VTLQAVVVIGEAVADEQDLGGRRFCIFSRRFCLIGRGGRAGKQNQQQNSWQAALSVLARLGYQALILKTALSKLPVKRGDSNRCHPSFRTSG
jgi:hypothetical protein